MSAFLLLSKISSIKTIKIGVHRSGLKLFTWKAWGKMIHVLVYIIYLGCALFETFRFGYGRFLPRIDLKRILKVTRSAICILKVSVFLFVRVGLMFGGKLL